MLIVKFKHVGIKLVMQKNMKKDSQISVTGCSDKDKIYILLSQSALQFDFCPAHCHHCIIQAFHFLVKVSRILQTMDIVPGHDVVLLAPT